jgi:hypothetical protein
MRKLIVLMTIAVLAFGASPVLAITLQNTFKVSGHLGVTTSTGKCTSLTYPAMCPSADNCICYTATKTSLHSATGGILTIPPGTTKVAVSVDTKDATSHPGCSPAWGEIQYNQTGGSDMATIEFFASLCKPLASTSPQTFSGGGALTSATLVFEGFPVSGITGFGTATGTYSAGASGDNFTLNLTAVITP